MIAYGRFVARGEIYEGFFEVKEGQILIDGMTFSTSNVKFLPPVEPTKIVCVGLNYRDHAEEFGMELPDEPVLFLKPPSAVIGDGEAIELPDCGRVDYEGELAVVIAKKCRSVSRSEALSYVLGFTCFNDVTARDLQRKDRQWTRSKSFDTFAPIGPYVACIDDASNLKIETRVNGAIKQSSNTSNLIFDVPRLIEFISGIMTLREGDVIATGTPSGVGPLSKGDVVEVEIEGIGVLRNRVV
jgi:2-keto-4-pentenoate hydratase/2-oxohepta-3-ene-1,7-dioic acid hydratase in catechol pathway